MTVNSKADGAFIELKHQLQHMMIDPKASLAVLDAIDYGRAID